MNKSRKRISQDYARNAIADGNTKEGRYEKKMAVKEAAGEGPSMKSKIYMSGAERYDIKEASDQDLSSSARKHYSENAQHNMKTRGGSSLSKHFQGNKRR